jgi:hypothetical protein
MPPIPSVLTSEYVPLRKKEASSGFADTDGSVTHKVEDINVVMLAADHKPIERAAAKLLLFSRSVLEQAARLGCDVLILVERYEKKTQGKVIMDPNAYLLAMARDEAAKAHGVTAETIKRTSSGTQAERAAAAAAMQVFVEPSPDCMARVERRLQVRGVEPEPVIAKWREAHGPFVTPQAAMRNLEQYLANELLRR